MDENFSPSPHKTIFLTSPAFFKQVGQKQMPPSTSTPFTKGLPLEDTAMRQNQLQFLLIQYARQEFDRPEQ